MKTRNNKIILVILPTIIILILCGVIIVTAQNDQLIDESALFEIRVGRAIDNPEF